MPGTPFEVEVHVGDDTTIDMSGDVNRAAQEGLEAAYAEAASGPGRLLLDFGDVDFINSTGIAVIVGILAKARAVGREVVAHGLSDHYREVFRITRLSDFMEIHEDSVA
jgi:anti-sigma B factor antagonist